MSIKTYQKVETKIIDDSKPIDGYDFYFVLLLFTAFTYMGLDMFVNGLRKKMNFFIFFGLFTAILFGTLLGFIIYRSAFISNEDKYKPYENNLLNSGWVLVKEEK